MFTIDSKNVLLNGTATTKEEGIRLAGNLMVDSGNIEPGYVESMLEREEVANTFIGNGMAIPHGVPKHRDLINTTAISLVQLPDGVDWNGNLVHILVGIAAKSDEHIEVLRHLTHLIDDSDALEKMRSTGSKDDIVSIITGVEIKTESAIPNDLTDYSHSDNCKVPGSVGLHARPATLFVEIAKKYRSKILVSFDNKYANGKSLVALLKLGAKGNSNITIYTMGDDAEEALYALVSAVKDGLGEVEEINKVKEQTIHNWRAQNSKDEIDGLPGSAGIAIGTISYVKTEDFSYEKIAKDPSAEKIKLKEALGKASIELDELYDSVKERSGESYAAIFYAHKEFLEDPDIVHLAHENIDLGYSAAHSWYLAFQENAGNLEQQNNQVLAERATDMRDVGQRVIRHLSDSVSSKGNLPDRPVILIADDLTPSDTAALDPTLVLGFCTAAGGPTSHTAITARSLNIPAIVGCGPAIMQLEENTPVILDGTNGTLFVGPSEKDIQDAKAVQETLKKSRDIQYRNRFEPAVTTDNHQMEVVANIGNVEDSKRAVEDGAEGIGLMRSEFLFLDRDCSPTEEEQYVAYKNIIQNMEGRPLIIRTLDIGGDKNVPYLNMAYEENSFLGVRGIRLCLEREDLFRTQLRAIYRASKKGPVSIMFPMISGLNELKAAKAICEDVRVEVEAEPVPIGIMIEVPSAVMMAEELAKEADFFSIGTNDLTQYTLAMDRLHPQLARQADGLHPAVLRMIDRTVGAAMQAGIWVGVCGGIAAEPLGSIILTGLGVKELSVNVPSVSAVKSTIRRISFETAVDISRKALECSTAEEVRELFQSGDAE
jgi:phosphoenolpyruvate-protein phosphotransferase